MAYYLNRAQLIGNVTANPEARQTSGGQMVVNFSVATNRSWLDKTGQRQEKADFHNIVAWGKLAELAQQYLQKGRKVFVEGRMETREWQGEDGVKRYKSEIIADNIIFLDSKGSSGSGSGDAGNYERAPQDTKSSGPMQEASQIPEEAVSLDDLPF
jgi:single-strand DNA-binding protein